MPVIITKNVDGSVSINTNGDNVDYVNYKAVAISTSNNNVIITGINISHVINKGSITQINGSAPPTLVDDVAELLRTDVFINDSEGGNSLLLED